MNQTYTDAPNHTDTGSGIDASLWDRLNTAYNGSEVSSDYLADYYWPTKDRRLPENDLIVKIVGVKVQRELDQPRLHFNLCLPTLGKKAIKSYRLVPESMRFLRTDMERLGIRVDDVRKLSAELKKVLNTPIQARPYFNPKTGWQDLDFIGWAKPAVQVEAPVTNPPDDLDFDFSG